MVYAAVQNGVILDILDTEEAAEQRVREEIKKDWLSILMKRSMRKLLKRSGDVALHRYSVLKISEVKDIK